MDLRWARARALPVGVDAAVLLVLVLLSAWLGGRVIGAVYVNNPKVDYVAPDAGPLVVIAWAATALQVCAAAVWRRWPQAAWLVAAGMTLVHLVTLHRLATLSPHPVRFAPLVPSDGVVLLALYGLTRAGRLRTAAVSCGLTIALAVCTAWAGPGDLAVLTGVLLVALTVTVSAAGLASYNRSSYLAAMTQRAVDAELARRRDAEMATLAERSRLAREIHDTVAHALGIIVVQAQGAAAAQDHRPAETAKALDAIVGVGRQALTEMRWLLTTQSSSPVDSVSLAPSGIADVPCLAEQLRDAGRQVDVAIHGVPTALPAPVDQAIYRIVQESLTNAARYANPEAAVLVDIRQADDVLQVEVRSAGTVAARVPSTGGGRGLPGMRERVLLLGGQFSAGPDAAGGFVVRASIPLPGTR